MDRGSREASIERNDALALVDVLPRAPATAATERRRVAFPISPSYAALDASGWCACAADVVRRLTGGDEVVPCVPDDSEAGGAPLAVVVRPHEIAAVFDAPPFDAAGIATFLRLVVRAAEARIAGREAELVDDAERTRLLAFDLQTQRVRDPRDSVVSLFREMAARRPDAVALVDGDRSWSYRELDEASSRIAAALRAAGVQREDRVGIAARRSAESIAALIGILAAGAAYVPVDRSHPAERVRALLRDAGVRVLIVDRIGDIAADGVRSVELGGLLGGVEEAGDAALSAIDGATLAYVLFTSGSTGTPKGVAVEHRSIVRLVRGNDYLTLADSTRMLHAAPLGFDASTLEIWGPLSNGGTVVLHDEAVPTAAGLARTIARHRVNTAWLTAALFNAVVDEDALALRGLRELAIGGEALSPAHVRKAYATLPELTLVNGYGPTECTTFTATWRIPRTQLDSLRTIPIGTPIADTQLFVLGPQGDLLPNGLVGELYVGGAGLARGYLGRDDLTAERFVPNPFDGGATRLYRTGDLVRRGDDGVVEFIGRRDGQVKLRGFRIETGEIEQALRTIDGVENVAVVLREDGGAKQLVAYVVGTADVAAVRESASRALPDFMVPTRFVSLPSLPRTPNGKLDVAALPAPSRERPPLAAPFEAPVDALETHWCRVFASVLGLDDVGRNDNFFDLGGDSLRALRAIAAFNREHAAPVEATTFFRDPTPRALAQAGTAGSEPRVQSSTASAVVLPMAQSEPVAIIAMAGRFPGAESVERFWRNLCEGRDTISRFDDATLDPSIPTSLRDDPAYVRARGVIDDFDKFDAAFFGISAREAELMDPQQRLMLELSWELLERAGYVPDAGDASIGVFAGMYNASYFYRHVQHHPDRIARVGEFQVMLGNEKDYIATRVAHKLDLKGPAISVHTACSTSLVAIAQAFDALRRGDCDMAIAGGVSITCPPNSGYFAQEGSMLSPDGHTRTFDERAAGTVFSDGAALVLLKRLSDAIADGDTIHAVIRGAAVNNDGGVKASFTAPSSAGQAAVIRRALQVAQVSPRSISYVETHGTATPLGDPIEVEGLTLAFSDGQPVGEELRQTCALGSLKSNVGHLVIAAGAAGVIKTALALRERKLPATLHFTRPNPALKLEASPFFVNAQLADWDSPSPRRAGVSSFGVGGTNAHVVLEEAPATAPSDEASGPFVLPFSARTPASLDAARLRLADHFASHPDVSLADAAHTLATGRKAFPLRAAIVAHDAREAAERLRALDVSRFAKEPAGASDVVFMFPGQGSQYAQMGRGLYEAEPVFRDAFDACAEAARETLGRDLRALVFEGDADTLAQTAVTQPATFAIEYALAQLWLSLGVRPAALVGHSVGEFVAATIAGVFTLRDALRLVATRGAVMQAQPPGAMLSVRLPAEQLAARIDDTVSLAAENAPNASVVAGPFDAIERLQGALEADGVACRKLVTSHAFHSAMMDPCVPAMRAALEGVVLSPPAIPIVSTVTGQLLTNDEARSPDYWATHLRRTVRFSAAISNLMAAPRRVLLELGPRAVLTTLARAHRAPAGSMTSAVASLADARELEHETFLAAAGELWRRGVAFSLSALDRRARKRRVELPTYAFERVRHWVDAPVLGVVNVARVDDVADVGASSAGAAAPDAGPDSVGIDSSTSGALRKLFDDVAGLAIEPADDDRTFLELGLDSLALTQVALHVSRRFDAKVTFRQLMTDTPTIAALAKWVEAQSQPAPATAAPRAVPAPIAFDASRPPVAGARLGRDPDGKPGWFVPNPDAPGKYLKVTQ